MSWTNFIIIPRLKLIVEAPRALDSDLRDGKLSEYTKEILNGIEKIGDDDRLSEVEEKQCSAVTIADMKVLQDCLQGMLMLRETTHEAFLLHWLEKMDIEYEVVSEYAMEGRTFPKDYVRVSLFGDEGEE